MFLMSLVKMNDSGDAIPVTSPAEAKRVFDTLSWKADVDDLGGDPDVGTFLVGVPEPVATLLTRDGANLEFGWDVGDDRFVVVCVTP